MTYWLKKLQWMKCFMINEIFERKNIKQMKSCMIDEKLHNFGSKAENLKLYNR